MDVKQEVQEAIEPSTDRGVNSCRNCGTPAPGKYCPECGQETAAEVQATGQFLRNLINRNVGVGGRFG